MRKNELSCLEYLHLNEGQIFKHCLGLLRVYGGTEDMPHAASNITWITDKITFRVTMNLMWLSVLTTCLKGKDAEAGNIHFFSQYLLVYITWSEYDLLFTINRRRGDLGGTLSSEDQVSLLLLYQNVLTLKICTAFDKK